MYDPHTLLAGVDANVAGFLALGGITMVFNYTFFVAAIINARRDKTFAFPLAASTIWFAHDLNFVLQMHQWFEVYNHWYLKLFWAALVPTTGLELLFIYHAWKYGRDEIFPGSTQHHFNVYLLGAVALGAVGWLGLKALLGDPIYAWTFGATGFLAIAFCLPRYFRIGPAGQSRLMWIAFCGMEAFWTLTTALYFGPFFRTASYLLLMATCVAGGAVMVLLLNRNVVAPVRSDRAF